MFPFIMDSFYKKKSLIAISCSQMGPFFFSYSKHIVQYYSTLRRKEILSYATTWINCEDIMLNEINNKKRQILHNYTHMRYLMNHTYGNRK